MKIEKSSIGREAHYLRRLIWLERAGADRGNIGLLKFSVGEISTKAMIIAASTTISDDLRDALRADDVRNVHLVKLASSGARKRYVYSSFEIYSQQIMGEEDTDAHIIPVSFECTEGRQHDSEFLLLNYVQYFICSMRPPSIRISLFSELAPCQSCGKVILQFLEANPTARVVLYHSRRWRANHVAHTRLSICRMPLIHRIGLSMVRAWIDFNKLFASRLVD